MATNVRNLRPVPTRPYDREHDEGVSVVLPAVGWALVHRILDASEVTAVRDCAEQIAVQMRAHQSRRLHPSISKRGAH